MGDSFTIPLKGEMYPAKGSDIAAYNLRCAACMYARRHNMKFTVRTVRAEGVARCWRIA